MLKVLVSKSRRISRRDGRFRAYVPLDRESTVVWVRATPDLLNRAR